MTRLIRQTDLWAGLLCVAIGATALWLLAGLRMGSIGAMGPAFTPVWLARAFIGIGLVIALKGAAGLADSDVLHWRWAALRPMALVLGTIVLYALALPRLGFAVTSLLLLLGAAAAGRDFRWREAVTIGLSVSLAATMLFIYVLKLNIAAWPL